MHFLIIDSLRTKFPSQFNNYPGFYIQSDGCASHFRSRFVFALMTNFNPDNPDFQLVKSKKCVINGAKDFAEYANKIIDGISSLYLAENDIVAEPQDIKTSPKIPKALKVHKVLRNYNEENVCKMEFYELAAETKQFHSQWYSKDGDPEVCEHNQLPLSHEIDQTYAYCKERYKGNEEWFKCELCN